MTKHPALVRLPSSAKPRPPLRTFALAAALVGLAGTAASAQLTISIAYQGPSAPTNGGSLDPGAALVSFPGTWTPPGVFWGSFSNLGLFSAAYNSTELDALSWGEDSRLVRNGPYWGGNYRLFFSTDEFAQGDSGLSSCSVWEDKNLAPFEASADVQRTPLFMSQPAPPTLIGYGHGKQFDGDGFGPCTKPDLGLVEPNAPAAGPDSGDTLDALDGWQKSADMRLYFSLDADWLDPLEGFYANSGSAAVNGFAPGDVLVSDGTGFGSTSVWAPHFLLGLGPDDDLDALILWENGSGSFEPSQELFDWMGGSRDMLLFSVRRGSPVIGMPDSQHGLPIREGDVLSTPCTVAPCVATGYPAIFIRHDSLGLEPDDELDALMVR